MPGTVVSRSLLQPQCKPAFVVYFFNMFFKRFPLSKIPRDLRMRTVLYRHETVKVARADGPHSDFLVLFFFIIRDTCNNPPPNLTP